MKFQRCIKCLATSLAAFPCTTEEMSCQGILGVVYLSIKSIVEHIVKKEDRKHLKCIEKTAFNNTINLGLPGLMIIEMKKTKSSQAVIRVAHHQKACPAEPSLCRQSCSSLCRAKSVCFPSALPLLSEDCALSHSLNNTRHTKQLYNSKELLK